MKILILVIALFIHAIGIAQTVTCDEVKRFKPKGLRESHASFELQSEKIQNFSYSGVMSSGEEGGAYFCDLAVALGDKKSNWETEGKKTTITIHPNRDENPSTIEIIRDGKMATIEFNIEPTKYCGFGAEFPSKMIKTSSGRCKVFY